MLSKPSFFYEQSGAIPWRRNGVGELEVLLVTSRGSGRWIIPKGIVEPCLTPAESAAEEALEEAGVRGRVSNKKVGGYQYFKWRGICEVEVYLLEVEEVLDDWLERRERRRRWFSPLEAAGRVRDPDLKELLARLPQLVDGR